LKQSGQWSHPFPVMGADQEIVPQFVRLRQWTGSWAQVGCLSHRQP